MKPLAPVTKNRMSLV